ncbi:uncharacterized protein C6orf136 homolog [Anthonomus grandis grandis]|uniref:uncharacterized protein C6orf136 homolog n=1 Tax=Anthonomus grandis grandis TaxID=2921223 RepID=UPI00216514BE|nr:uncharacterized protein C6orf136 homolog [Anthonomus grandis grandis]
MAPAFRYINKLTGRFATSKHLQFIQQKYPVSQRKQYSRGVLQVQHKPNESYLIDNVAADNREHAGDIVTKIKLDPLVLQEKLNVTNSPAAPKDNVVLTSDSAPEPSGRPSPEKLLHVYNILADSLPNLFIKPLDYTIYHPNMVFEDNIRNVKTVGLLPYVKQVALLRTIGHIKFAFVKFDVLKITQHPEDGTVRVRWRIRGLKALKVMLQFWKYKLWNWKGMLDQCEDWYDGYSTFVVNSDGLVVRHVADKMMPDSDNVSISNNGDLTNAKLALMIAVIPRMSDVVQFM